MAFKIKCIEYGFQANSLKGDTEARIDGEELFEGMA
jgi:hypothetical protein